MVINKFGECKKLTEYDLSVELFGKFGLKVVDVVPVRDVFVAATDKGDKVLKKIDYTENELRFIYEGIQYIMGKFPRIIDFMKDQQGNICTAWKGELYCVMDLVDGRECDFSNPLDVQIAARGLGELHKASEGFKGNNHYKCLNGRLIDNFKRRREEMNFFKSLALMHERKDEFDRIFLNNVDYYWSQIDESISTLENSQYYKVCSEEDKVVLCHHDLAHHNILIKDEKAYFVDFDYAVIDLKVHDLCNFINKVAKNFAFDADKYDSILHAYCQTNSMDRREEEILKGMLCFPDDFYTICKDYYSRRKDWDDSVFISRLEKKCSFRDDRNEFINEIKNRHL